MKNNPMNILYLPLNRKWYRLIRSGEKTAEYREIKPYWIKRICCLANRKKIDDGFLRGLAAVQESCAEAFERGAIVPKAYTHVKFTYGYTKRSMTFEIKGIGIGRGRPEWGAPEGDVFVISLGNRIDNISTEKL